MMEFREDVEFLGDLALMLLRKLDPEPVYVKRHLKMHVRRLKKRDDLSRKEGGLG